ncbi:class I adenylate-forming enzyme family protein [Trebonia sp.]|uniref:class I adenylate-forming enzyme family protein n=1 Tax=Trebonia sp. TaxID=2767075 RepID=UPI0026142BC8|nr:fatty acid--CoA ligase family protein [Trebonia sp.]
MGLSLILEMAVASHGERIVLAADDAQLTCGELAERVARAAAVIRGRGARQVAFVGRNGLAYPQLLFAAAHAGAAFVPLNYRLSADGLREQLRSLDDPLVVCDPPYLPVADGYAATATGDFLAQAANSAPVEEAAVDNASAAVVLFTSGTTSRPKAVVLRHENLLAYILSTVDLGAATEGDAALVAVPPYHVAAVGSALSNLYAGRRVVYLPDFAPAEWIRLAREQHVTTAMVVPTMLARIVDALDGAADLPDLKLISYGGAKMPVPVLLRALAAFPGTGFVNAYGLTETSSTIALLGPEEHREALDSSDPVKRARLASVGRPVPGIEVQVRREDGTPAEPGAPGELWIRGPQVSGAYAEQGSVLDEAGWFPTRDIARLDSDGYLFIEGRADDTIIRGGENIHPAEIEDVLLTHPGISDVAVVGLPDEEWGHKIVAVVVPRPAVTLEENEIRAYVRARLRGSRTPDEVAWRAGLPRTPTGKLLRRQLVEEMAL